MLYIENNCENMAHSEKRASVLREFQLAVFTGGIYGATHTISGHPLDTIKTRMQIDPAYAKLNTFQTTKLLYKEAGLIGFFRGCLPPLWGSTCYRSIMMSTYEASYTYFEGNYDKSHFVNQEYGIFRPLVIVGAFNASIFRGIVENPIEYAKLQGQTGKPWILKDIYRGLHWQLIRTTALLIPIFTIVDNARRKTELMKTLPGAFGVTCFASGFSYLAAWPVSSPCLRPF